MIDSVWDAPSSFSPQSVVLRRLTRNCAQLKLQDHSGEAKPTWSFVWDVRPTCDRSRKMKRKGKGKGKKRKEKRACDDDTV